MALQVLGCDAAGGFDQELDFVAGEVFASPGLSILRSPAAAACGFRSSSIFAGIRSDRSYGVSHRGEFPFAIKWRRMGC